MTVGFIAGHIYDDESWNILTARDKSFFAAALRDDMNFKELAKLFWSEFCRFFGTKIKIKVLIKKFWERQNSSENFKIFFLA